VKPTLKVRKVETADIPSVAATLARAFLDDPVLSWLLPRDRALQRMRTFFDGAIRHIHLRHGEVYTTEGYASAAVWDPPGHWRVGLLPQLRLAPQMLRAFGTRVGPAIRLLDEMERHHLAEPHFYLAILGTDPPYQGRGVGAATLAPVLRRCDAAGVVAYLESTNPSNVPFYRRQGFEVTREISVPGGPPLTLMRRPAH
jgi:GNAT superfamily N-acetyltransferase